MKITILTVLESPPFEELGEFPPVFEPEADPDAEFRRTLAGRVLAG
jgi:hypothetical protein